MGALYISMVRNFFIAFGVVIGASLFAGIAAIVIGHPPLKAMINLAESIKIWAMAIALGDTFSSFAAIEKGIFEGEFKSIVKQAVYVLTALLGSNTGYGFIKLIKRSSELWLK